MHSLSDDSLTFNSSPNCNNLTSPNDCNDFTSSNDCNDSIYSNDFNKYDLIIYVLCTDDTIIIDRISSDKKHYNLPKNYLQIFIYIKDGNIIYIKIKYCNKCVKIHDTITYSHILDSIDYCGSCLITKCHNYIESLDCEDKAVICKEFQHDNIVDDLLAGIAIYLSFIYLIENNAFSDDFPFNLQLPAKDNYLNTNMFRYLSSPLLLLSKLSNSLLLRLILFIQSFINIWSPLFVSGCDISNNDYTMLHLELISAFAHNLTSSIIKMQEHTQHIFEKLQHIEEDLHFQLDNYLNKVSEEVNNLLIDAKRQIFTNNSFNDSSDNNSFIPPYTKLSHLNNNNNINPSATPIISNSSVKDLNIIHYNDINNKLEIFQESLDLLKTNPIDETSGKTLPDLKVTNHKHYSFNHWSKNK